MGITDVQRLAIVQAIYKKAAELVSTKGDSLRSYCDEEAIHLYKSVGAKSYAVKLPDAGSPDGETIVGSYSVRVSKPRKVAAHLAVIDEAAFTRWAICNHPTHVRMVETVVGADTLLAEALAEGEKPDGCVLVEETNEPPQVLGTLFKIDADKVFEVAGRRIPKTVQKLLEEWRPESERQGADNV